MRKRVRITKTLLEIVMVLTSFIILIPCYMFVVNSFKSQRYASLLGMALPQKIEWSNYVTVFKEANVLLSYVNGFIYSVGSVSLVILLSSMAAYVIARRNEKVTEVVYYIFISGIVVPGAIIPMYLILKTLGLLDTRVGLIIIYTSVLIPFSVFLYTGFMKTVPKELDEAALVDGYSGLSLFFSIVFPLLKPVTITLVVLNFNAVWNNVIIQLYLSSSDKWGMPMSVYKFYGTYSKEWNLIFADIVISLIPVILVYILAQKHIIAGLTSGAVKG